MVGPSLALDKLRPAWEHKNWRARESTLLWFGRLLAQHESPAALGFALKPLLPTVCKLLEDREPPVREAATIAVEQMHRHTGDAIINELHRANLRPTTLKPLVQRLSGSDGGPVDIDDEGGGGGPSSPASHDGRTPNTARGGGMSSRRGAASPKRPGSGPPSARGPGPGGSSSGGWGSEAAATPGGDASGDSSGEVNPIPVYSEKELTSEIDKLAEHLRHPTDWAVRRRV